MRTTRRQFLKGLLATAAAGLIAPRALVESVHGASDLTPRERDIAAEVMGLRGKRWAGWSAVRTIRFPVLGEGGMFRELALPVTDDPGGMPVPWHIIERTLKALGFPSRVSATEHQLARKAVASWGYKGTAEKGEIWTTDEAIAPVSRRDVWSTDRRIAHGQVQAQIDTLGESNLMRQALRDAGYTPVPSESPEPEYVTPEWIRQALEKRA